MLLVKDSMTREIVTLAPDETVGTALPVQRKAHQAPSSPYRREAGGDRIGQGPPFGHPGVWGTRKGRRAARDPGRGRDGQRRGKCPPRRSDRAGREHHARRIGPPRRRGRELVGIITSSDVMSALVYLVGANEPGSRMEIAVPDRPGSLAGAAGVFGMCGINIVSAAMGPIREPNEEGAVRNASSFSGRHHRHHRGGRIPGRGRLLRPVAAQALSGRAAIVHDLALENYGFGGDHPFNPPRASRPRTLRSPRAA